MKLPPKSWLLLFIVCFYVSSCATTGNYRQYAIDETLEMCKQISKPELNEEAWFWFQKHRVEMSRRLWNPIGIQALEVRLASTPDVNDKICLQRTLREAHNREPEHY